MKISQRQDRKEFQQLNMEQNPPHIQRVSEMNNRADGAIKDTSTYFTGPLLAQKEPILSIKFISGEEKN